MAAGEALGTYIAIVGGLISGSFPASFYINAQPVGQPQRVVLKPGPADYTRTLVSFLTPQPSANSVAVGTALTAVLRWADAFSNTEDLELDLQVHHYSHLQNVRKLVDQHWAPWLCAKKQGLWSHLR